MKKCEHCNKELTDLFLVSRTLPQRSDTLSNLAVIYRLFCSERCWLLQKAAEWKKAHPHG